MAAAKVDPAAVVAARTDGGGAAYCDGCGGSVVHCVRVTGSDGRGWSFCSPCAAKCQTPEEARKAAVLARYTDEALQADLQGPSRGYANRARHLLLLDTPERRRRAANEGDTLVNLLGGRPSDQVHTAVCALKGLIGSGHEERELYGERVAREYREHEQAKRQAELVAAVARAGAR